MNISVHITAMLNSKIVEELGHAKGVGRVRTGQGKPGKSWNLRISFISPGIKSWNLIVVSASVGNESVCNTQVRVFPRENLWLPRLLKNFTIQCRLIVFVLFTKHRSSLHLNKRT